MAKLLLRKGRNFLEAECGKRGELIETDRVVDPSSLIHFGTELNKAYETNANNSYHINALIRADSAGADYVLVSGYSSTFVSGSLSLCIALEGAITFYLKKQ